MESITDDIEKPDFKIVRLNWYGILLLSAVSFFAFLGVMFGVVGIGFGVARGCCSRMGNEVIGLLLLRAVELVLVFIGIYCFFKLIKGLLMGRKWPYWFVLGLPCIIAFLGAMENVTAALYYLVIVSSCCALMLCLPHNERWYDFRYKWNIYKATHPDARLDDFECAKSESALRVVLSPQLAWPIFVIGIALLLLAFLVYVKAISMPRSEREVWSLCFLVIGLISMVLSFILFSKKK